MRKPTAALGEPFANAPKRGIRIFSSGRVKMGVTAFPHGCAGAAKGAQVHILRWAQLNGLSWNKWTCASAAEGGNLDVLQWCRGNGCPWNEWTCRAAARGGHLGVLKWARDNGCP